MDFAAAESEGAMEKVRHIERGECVEETVLETNEARQAVTGHKVRYVLAFGLAGVVLGFAIVWYLTASGAI